MSNGRTAVDVQNHTLTYVVPGQTSQVRSRSAGRGTGTCRATCSRSRSGRQRKPLSVAKWRKSSRAAPRIERRVRNQFQRRKRQVFEE